MSSEDLPVGGLSYPRSFRLVASLVVLGLLAGAWATRDALLRLEWTHGSALLLVGSVVIVALGYGHLMRSRTVLRGDNIEHGWLWVERIAWRDVTQAYLMHWPAMAWLVAPQLVLRAQGIGRRRVPMADSHVLARVQSRLLR